jgi:hypothetical protein
MHQQHRVRMILVGIVTLFLTLILTYWWQIISLAGLSIETTIPSEQPTCSTTSIASLRHEWEVSKVALSEAQNTITKLKKDVLLLQTEKEKLINVNHVNSLPQTTTTSSSSNVILLNSQFVVDEVFNITQLHTSTVNRYRWGISTLPVVALNSKKNTNMALTASEECKSPNDCTVSQRWFWSGFGHSHERFDMMGPVVNGCKKIHKFGTGDEEKRVCWSSELSKPGCVVYSIGSNDQFGFETSVAQQTPCMIHTFDCTVPNPRNIPQAYRDRIAYHAICLGSKQETTSDGKRFETLAGITELVGKRATFLKMDIEGFEWDVLPAIISSAVSAITTSSPKDVFPTQIAVEVHYLTQMEQLSWRGRDKSAGEIFALFNYLFYSAGYAVIDRNDNPFCPHCSEIVLARVMDVGFFVEGG